MNDINFDLVQKTFLDIIRKIINADYKNETIKFKLNDEEKRALFNLSNKHDLAHFLAIGIDNYECFFDEKLSKKIKNVYLMSIIRYEQMSFEYEEIKKTFNKEKIPFVPLKGAILRKYYDEPWHRTSCDIDILIHEKNLEKAINALVKYNQFRTDGKTNYHDVSLFSPSNIHLELHFNILEAQDNIDKLLTKVWDYIELKEENFYEYNQTTEFLIFHLVSHLLYHFLEGGCGVRTIMDLWIIHNKLFFNKAILYSYLNECGIVKFYESIMELANVWFNCDKYTEKIRKMENYILSGGVYGSLENRMKIVGTNVDNNKKYALNRIFCPYKIMKNRYPILRKHKWLLPFYEVVRWCETIFTGKSKKLKKELEILDRNSNIEKEDFKKFLTEIGL